MGASRDMEFDSYILKHNKFAEDVPNEQIKNEPMFFNSDFDFAMEKGGPITRSFLEALPPDWKSIPLAFDSRVHMLMPGWYPAIPGWHHDDVPRPAIPPGQHFITAGQPDYDNPRYRSEHILGLVNADVCPTAFALGKIKMPAIPKDELIYRTWHLEVEKLKETGQCDYSEAEDRRLYYFNCDTFHTGTCARSTGWRWFGRVTRNSDRTLLVTNEIRVNSQVYLEFPMEGW